MRCESGMYGTLTGGWHGVVLNCDLSGSVGFLSCCHEKKFQVWQKVSDVVIFGVIYLRSSGTSVFVVVVP